MKKLHLAHLPTPLWHHDALDELVGTEVWVKRDDMTSGAAAGNKIRKLEYLLSEAVDRHASVVVTCGALQSNHARATALVARELGMRSVLFLRTPDGKAPGQASGNVLLDQMVGAEFRFVTPDEYQDRGRLMGDFSQGLIERGERPYVIPEGGSNGVGAFGYLSAMGEVKGQLNQGQGGGPLPFDAIVHACGSGGTAAGCVLGARALDVAPEVHAFAVGGDAAYFQSTIPRIVRDAIALGADAGPLADLLVHDAWIGPGYGEMSEEQHQFLFEVSRRSGLILDPVYTGKALFGLSQLPHKPARVLFLHTGGLPGLLAQTMPLDSTPTR